MLEKIKENSKLVAIIGAFCAAILIAILAIVVNNGGQAIIKYSDENRNATITIGEGSLEEESGMGEAGEELEVDDIPTVEYVDAPGAVTDGKYEEYSKTEPEDGLEHGLGYADIWADISSPWAFKDSAFGRCWDSDFYAGSQCWDQENVFWLNYTGRALSTCGTGAAKGTIEDGCWQRNAGSEFTMIWDARNLQAGDIVVFNNGTWGHIGMAMGAYNNGYITLLGQNQGGAGCPNGGAAGNIINISLTHFAGAFRPNIYIAPEPEPEPVPEPEPAATGYSVVKGDTLGRIALNFCGYRGNKLFGDDGYAQSMADFNNIPNRGLIYPLQVVYCPILSANSEYK